MSAQVGQILARLQELGSRDIAAHSRQFFKAGKGGYGERDRFFGIRVPVLRKCAAEFRGIVLEDVPGLLASPFHEARLLGLLILVAKYSSAGSASEKRTIYRMYLNHTKFINNWDLVDSTAEHIVGAYLLNRDRRPLYQLARSKSLWERRISIMSTFHFIRRGDFADTLKIADLLLNDREDLIHKAVGWMLREVGKRNVALEEEFLGDHYAKMPRTMLRYAVEKFPTTKRQAYLGRSTCYEHKLT